MTHSKQLNRFEKVLHTFNRYVNLGWNNYIGQYFTILSLLGVLVIGIAAIFPLFASSTIILSAGVFVAIVFISYRSGQHHKKNK